MAVTRWRRRRRWRRVIERAKLLLARSEDLLDFDRPVFEVVELVQEQLERERVTFLPQGKAGAAWTTRHPRSPG